MFLDRGSSFEFSQKGRNYTNITNYASNDAVNEGRPSFIMGFSFVWMDTFILGHETHFNDFHYTH